MSFSRTFYGSFRPAFVLFLLFIAGASSAFAETNEFGIDISNFGKINDNYYRGGQPDEADMVALKKNGSENRH